MSDVPIIMDVQVISPWMPWPPWHTHTVVINGVHCAALLNGRPLPAVDLFVADQNIRLEANPLTSLTELTGDQLDILDQFTKMGIWWRVTASPVVSRLACYSAPLDDQGFLDGDSMEYAIENRVVSYDWSDITESDEGARLVMNAKQHGRTLLLKKLNTGLSLDETPPSGIVNGDFTTWMSYFPNKWPLWHGQTEEGFKVLPLHGPILEVQHMVHSFSAVNNQELRKASIETEEEQKTIFVPQSYFRSLSRLALSRHSECLRPFASG